MEFRFILLVFTITGSLARYSMGQIRASLKFDWLLTIRLLTYLDSQAGAPRMIRTILTRRCGALLSSFIGHSNLKISFEKCRWECTLRPFRRGTIALGARRARIQLRSGFLGKLLREIHAWEADVEEADGGKLAARNDACAAKFAIAKVDEAREPAAQARPCSRCGLCSHKPILGLQELQQFGFSRARFRLKIVEPPNHRRQGHQDRLNSSAGL